LPPVLFYCARRILLALVLAWAVASAAFVLTRLAPGDATLVDDDLPTAEEREAARQRLGLDQPLLVQYGRWLRGSLRLDFGQSTYYRRPVGELVRERAINTAILAIAALLLAALFGITGGIYTATEPRGLGVHLVRAVSIVFLSTPPLLGALILVLVAARTGWLPVGGMSTTTGGAWWDRLQDLVRHLPVPALALALPLAASLERVQSESLGGVLRLPFLSAARARGVSTGDAIRHHAWPLSLGPVLALYGLMIGTLFSGSFVVEVVTAWPGLGRLIVEAIQARDLDLVAGTAAAGAVGLALATLAGDLVHAALDPRIREDR
jgi:peptide/nickel transport system permease protein